MCWRVVTGRGKRRARAPPGGVLVGPRSTLLHPGYDVIIGPDAGGDVSGPRLSASGVHGPSTLPEWWIWNGEALARSAIDLPLPDLAPSLEWSGTAPRAPLLAGGMA
jgi:hypothetical protein